jgi:hypothetical protein
MAGRVDTPFMALILTQAAHSLEEWLGRLWETFPPARMLSGLVASDHQLGFIILNTALVLFGLWCYVWPVRRRWRSSAGIIWLWVGIETVNGIVHPLWSLSQRHYTPGLATAPLLLALALFLGRLLRGHSP